MTVQSGDRSPPTNPLLMQLGERIGAEGPITFAEFMETALYDPEYGFYEQAAVGEEAHFVTSPHVSPLFAELLAGQLNACWVLLDEPEPFDVVEVGAGHGTLARQLLDSLSGPIAAAVRYTAVERSRAGRAAMAAAGLPVASDLGELDPGLVGCVIANELLDNLPFHRLRGTDHGPVELLVGVRHGGLELVEGPISSDGLLDAARDLEPGRETVASPAAIALLERAQVVLRRGYVWLMDYGSEDRSIEPSVHGYRRHRLEDDVLAEPGASDITSGVDFGALVEHARRRGLHTWGPVSQREALLALGFAERERAARARQGEALRSGRGREAVRIFSARTRARLLIDEEGLGAFRWLCLGIGIGAQPRPFGTNLNPADAAMVDPTGPRLQPRRTRFPGWR